MNDNQRNENYAIRQCFQPDGDWFQVHLLYEKGETKVFIDRVIMWAVVDADGRGQRVDAITDDGTPNAILEIEEGDYYFVKALDKSPSGKTWAQLYEEITPSLLGIREISSAQAFPDLDG